MGITNASLHGEPVIPSHQPAARTMRLCKITDGNVDSQRVSFLPDLEETLLAGRSTELVIMSSWFLSSKRTSTGR